MKFKSLAYLLLALSLSFPACTEGDDNAITEPVEKPEQKPEERPEEPQTIVVEAEEFVGEYVGAAYTPDAGCYALVFSSNTFAEGGGMVANSSYYLLEVYADLYDGKDTGYVQMPEGTYTLDKDGTMTKGSINAEFSYYMSTNDTEMNDLVAFDSAELVITATKATLTAVVQGVKHVVTFEGQATVADKRAKDKEVKAHYAWAYYYGDGFSRGVADNFYLFLSDIDDEFDYTPKASYYVLDLYSEIIDPAVSLAIPYGTYTFDASNSHAPYTISATSDTYFFTMDEYGKNYTESGYITDGTIVVDESGITAELKIMGATHKVTFKGFVNVGDYRTSIL